MSGFPKTAKLVGRIPDKRIGFLDMLWIDQKFRRLGEGRRLLQRWIEAAFAARATLLVGLILPTEIPTRILAEFYASKGFGVAKGPELPIIWLEKADWLRRRDIRRRVRSPK